MGKKSRSSAWRRVFFFLAAGFIPALAAAPAPAGWSSQASRARADDGFKVFHSVRLGVRFRYPAGYKLVAASPSPPEAAAFELELLKPRPSSETGRPPYIRHYKISFYKLDLPATAQAAGFAEKDGEWTFRDREAGTEAPAKLLSGKGWKGLSGSYTTRLYLPQGAQVPPNFWHAGRYLGLSNGERIVVSGSGTISIVLDLDPNLETKSLRETILRSLRLFAPKPPLR